MSRPSAADGRAGRAGANIVKMFTSNVGILVVTFAVTVLLSRWLQPTGKGLFSLIILIPLTLARLGNLGLPLAFTHFAGKREPDAAALATGATVMAGGVGLLGIAAFVLIERHDPLPILAHAPANAKLVAVCALPFLLWLQSAGGLILGLDEQAAYRGMRMTESVVLLAGVLILVLASDLALSGALAAWLVAQACATAIAGWALWRAGVRRRRWDSALLGRCLRYGGAAWIGGTASFLLLRVDLFLVNLFLGPAAVGQYSVAIAVFGLLFTLPVSAATAVLPDLTRSAPPAALRIATVTSRTVTLACIALAAIAALLAPVLVPLLFGQPYAPAVAPLLILLPAFLLVGAGGIANAGLQGLGRIRTYAYANVTGLAVNVALNLWWIPRWGLPGAAAASTVAYTLVAAIHLVAYARAAQTPLASLLIFRGADWPVLCETVRGRLPARPAAAAETPPPPSTA